MEKTFLQTLNIYRGKAALQISPSPELSLIFVNLAPAIPGMEAKMPDKNQKKYQWEKKLTVSFNFNGAMEVAATAEALFLGREELITDPQGNLPSWYRDPAKTGRPGQPKTLGFFRGKNPTPQGKTGYFLGIIENSRDKNGAKVGIPLEQTDLYKIAHVMREAALALLGWRRKIEEAKNGQQKTDKEPLSRPPIQDPDFPHDPSALDKKQAKEKPDEEIF